MSENRNREGPPRDEAKRRKNLRLSSWDYGRPGFYCVTIVTQGRVHRFGAVRETGIVPSPAGAMVECWIARAHERFPDVMSDSYVIMPDHLHWIFGMGTEDRSQPAETQLGDIVGWLKAMTTSDYAAQVRSNRWAAFDRRLWQRGYHDRVVRNEDELTRIRHYIASNPARWLERHRVRTPRTKS